MFLILPCPILSSVGFERVLHARFVSDLYTWPWSTALLCKGVRAAKRRSSLSPASRSTAPTPAVGAGGRSVKLLNSWSCFHVTASPHYSPHRKYMQHHSMSEWSLMTGELSGLFCSHRSDSMQDPAYELRRIHLRNCLKRGAGDAPSVDLGGVRKQKCRSGGP
jgi:hypothetical protein